MPNSKMMNQLTNDNEKSRGSKSAIAPTTDSKNQKEITKRASKTTIYMGGGGKGGGGVGEGRPKRDE